MYVHITVHKLAPSGIKGSFPVVFKEAFTDS